jgi:acyl-CoA thioesterase-2
MERVDVPSLLDLENAGPDLFWAPEDKNPIRQRLFGGQVAAQALVAVSRTVDPDRIVHSLHSYFLRPGNSTLGVDFEVTRERDGQSFTTRHVEAKQRGQTIFSLTASFQREEQNQLHHQEVSLDVPPPEECRELQDWFDDADREKYGWYVENYIARHPLELRFPQKPAPLSAEDGPTTSKQGMWMRFHDTLPDDRLVHRCALAYASDFYLISSALRPHGITMQSQIMVASLDHSMWFHSEFRADDWFYYDLDSPWSGGGRGLAFGRFFNTSGELFATAAQEGLMRVKTR